MPRREVTEEEKRRIQRRVEREFPSFKMMQDLHYYRYVKEIEWQTMSPAEIVEDIRKGAQQVKEEMRRSARARKEPSGQPDGGGE